MLGSAADAEDAVQEVFASVVRSRQRIAGVANLEAYLFVALRRAAGRIRRRERFRPTGDLDESWMTVRAGEGKGPDESEDLRRAVQRLPVEQRETLALKMDGELTFAQIGEVLGISPNTAASRYRYALEKLRQVLEKDDDTRNRNAP
jgi:RNA polymerase sigma-70 factor (ECF subfamily)